MHTEINNANYLSMGSRTLEIDMDSIKQLRLMHLMCPSLPTGGFSYSQGLEWAVETGWVTNDVTLKKWLIEVLNHSLSRVDIPLIKRLYSAFENNDIDSVQIWVDSLLAMRETKELLLEEQTRGRALTAIIKNFGLANTEQWAWLLKKSQAAGYAFAAATWSIPVADFCLAYLWAWLENQVMAGIKLIPLGQSSGQRLIYEMDDFLVKAVNKGLYLPTEEIGSSLPALAIGSSLHENQYTRLFRS